MKTKFLLIFSALICTISLNINAQITVNPNHEFYKDAQNWYLNGWVDQIPPLRPYSKLYVNDILDSVIEKGSPIAQEKAKQYFEELNHKMWSLSLSTEAGECIDSNDNLYVPYAALYPSVNGDLSFLGDNISMGYNFGLGFNTTYYELYIPEFSNPYHDYFSLSHPIGDYLLYLDLNNCLSLGNRLVFFQCGIYKTGYGPFIGNGVALNDTAFHSANLSFTIIKDFFTYAQTYEVLGASKNYDGSSVKPEKFLTFHQLSFDITKKIQLSYYETIVYGNRFDPAYFIPAPYMVTQGLGGCNDNLQMGLLLEYNIFKGFLWSADIFVDDLNVNELIKFNFDTKIRIAAQTGILYSFDLPVLNSIAMSYTLITPFTYAHSDYSKSIYWYSDSVYNYQNYTNSGVSIGSSLPPNSEAVNFSFSLTPVKNLKLELTGFYARHGNSTENYDSKTAIQYLAETDSEKYCTDGSIFQHQALNNDVIWSTVNHLNFLNQKNQMYVIQAGINASYQLPYYKWGKLSFNGSYTFEYIHNKGVDSNMYPGGLVTANEDGTYTINGTSSKLTAQETTDYFYNKWKENLYDLFSSYFHIGIEYKF